MTTTAEGSVMDMREAFEEEMVNLGHFPDGWEFTLQDNGEYLHKETRTAFAAYQAALSHIGDGSRAEPVIYQRRQRPLFGVESQRYWTEWENCTKGNFEDIQRTPVLHDWEHQARELFAHAPTAQDSDEDHEHLHKTIELLTKQLNKTEGELRAAQDSKVPEGWQAAARAALSAFSCGDDVFAHPKTALEHIRGLANLILSAAPVPDKVETPEAMLDKLQYVGEAVPDKPQWSCPPEVIRAANSLERAIKTAPHVSSDIMRALNSLQLQLTATGLQRPAAPEGE